MNQLIDGREPERPTASATRDDDLPAPGTGTGGRFLRTAAFVGDLASPFYDEERQRDVWNEASAIGLQFLFWSGMTAATAMIWIGRRPAVAYAVTLWMLIGLAGLLTLGYAKRLGVDTTGGLAKMPRRTLRRSAPVLALQLAFFFGLIRAVDDLPADAAGWAVGLAVGAVVLTLGTLGQRRRGRARSREAESHLED